jgi:pimeloyl-ACP methyl ester carboxylesterase
MYAGYSSSARYQKLALALAESYTVYIPDRRGRGDSGPFGEQYCISKEIEDLSALMEKTDARIVFGHSTGALFALEAAVKLPIEKLILYEPVISINHSLPINWLPAFEVAVSKKQYSKAMAILNKGFLMSMFGKLPLWMSQLFIAMMFTDDQRFEINDILTALIKEIKIVLSLDSTYATYSAVKADTLLLGGTNSPLFLLGVIPTLASRISNIKIKLLPGLNHTAPEEDAPDIVAGHLLQFLSFSGMSKGDLGGGDIKSKEKRFLLINDQTLSMEH